MANTNYHKHVLRFYNSMANTYDLTEIFRKKTRSEVIDTCDWKPGDKVLDICTGTGEMALAFAQNDLAVTGIDLAEGMLMVANEKPSLRPPKWLVMDAEHLEFPNDSFEITTIALALHHMPEDVQVRVLTEATRVTKNKVVIVDYNPPKNKKVNTLWGIIFSFLDQSELMKEWAKQNLSAVFTKANLRIKKRVITTMGLHQILVLEPLSK